MQPLSLILGGSCILTGLLVIGICLPLAKGSVKMNRLYGIRFKRAFESEENWYKINQFGAKQLIRWSKFLVIVGVVVLFLPLNSNWLTISVFGLAPLLLLLPAVIATYRYAHTL